LIVVKVVLVMLLRMNPGVFPPEVNWPTMLPLSLIPKALMAMAGVVRVCNRELNSCSRPSSVDLRV
jgi:hypothetical protein